ncbi:O-antigen ligase family protein [Dokdonia ponticola]|uniref:O-antigen ligase family protein n=1 Tax=Dokdonia ponticola TaxID=2041041 RepID=A0ABV9I398_9FLAO
MALLAAGYITGGEVFFRMTGASFAYEAGKYGVIFFILLGLFLSGTSRKSGPYWLYLLFLIPAIVISSITLDYDTDFRKAVIFNLSGPFCLGITALYCIDRKITYKQLQDLCWSILMPIVAMGVYLYFYTPDTREVISGTGSNFATSGGFGPNQVSTALGLGIFFVIVQIVTQTKSVTINLLNLGLLSLLGYRAIVTFSRGGVITAIIISAVFIFIYFRGVSTKTKSRLTIISFVIVIIASVTWVLSSTRTGGLIDKRYANKDAAGRIKEDVSTGRSVLINSELEAFYAHPVAGVGVGKIKEYRKEQTGISAASHNEMSRLLSEHGIAGIFALLILLIYPLLFRFKHRGNYLFYSVFAFWFLTINHSSMRIAAPGFIYALCLLNVVNEKKKNPVHRKRINA